LILNLAIFKVVILLIGKAGKIINRKLTISFGFCGIECKFQKRLDYLDEIINGIISHPLTGNEFHITQTFK
jgi:hypothetical protein